MIKQNYPLDKNNIFNKCRSVDGYTLPLSNKLRVKTYENVFSDRQSLYSENQQLISDSSFFRGVPEYDLLNASNTTKLHPNRIKQVLSDNLYFWLGVVHLHFGHFLISTLSRLWALKQQPKNIMIAYIGLSPTELFNIPYVAYVFNQLGIQKHRLKNIGEPTFFKKIVIAERSLNENHSISYLHKKTLEKIYPSLNNNLLQEEYIYVSKSKVSKGVRSIGNEDNLCDYLTSKGIKCIFPEQLAFKEQLEFWKNNKNFVGFSSSAFHLSEIFGQKNIIMINHSSYASSNHILCDTVAKNNTVHIYPKNITNKGKTNNFSEMLEIPNIQEFGDAIIDIINNVKNKTITPQKTPGQLFSLSKQIFKNEPLGENISTLGIPTQSSIYEYDEGKNVTPQGVICGKLTGSYQCHTRLNKNPWWQIEYKDLYLFTELRIYNRLDSDLVNGQKRSLSL